ncbi:DUF1007 family protein [Pseudooceanicola sp. LIPI14-2-Ac024]|uniref:DUF1007 family protein n=1 Tax=Pseudooceanicola sp. LIPI14-2-Ac024 TaxID=3344875 RepID=UPI0035CFF730
MGMLLRPVRQLATAALALGAGPVEAHPHIFVDTTLVVVTDDAGVPQGVEVTWTYDELYTLLIFEDMGLDADYDGELTAEELSQIDGFDMQWVEGYAGDLYATGPGGELAFGPPEPRGTEVAGGRITTHHYRPLAAPGPRQLDLRAYDPTFYTGYDLTGGVKVPEGCEVAITPADLDAARARAERELAGRPETIEDYPEVGDAFADTATVRCGEAE